MQTSIKVLVTHTSLESMAEAGWDIGDNGFAESNFYGQLMIEKIMSCFTGTQQKIAILLFEGMPRKEISKTVMVSEQAIHQIIPRMRKRLKARMGIDLNRFKRKYGGV